MVMLGHGRTDWKNHMGVAHAREILVVPLGLSRELPEKGKSDDPQFQTP